MGNLVKLEQGIPLSSLGSCTRKAVLNLSGAVSGSVLLPQGREVKSETGWGFLLDLVSLRAAASTHYHSLLCGMCDEDC